MVKKVAIVGAGPSGVLLAHYLLRRGDRYRVDIYERRSDPRTIEFSNSRTFPISLNQRGVDALSNIAGLLEAVKEMGVAGTASIMHQNNGKTRFTPRRKPLLLLDRTLLAIALLEKLTATYDSNRLNIYFNHQCTQVDLSGKTATFLNAAETTIHYDWLVGADGARSTVRDALLLQEQIEVEQKSIPNDYKSIFLPPSDQTVQIGLKPGYIHAWRIKDGTGVLLVYQLDGSMNGIINFPRENNRVVSLSTPEEVLQFFDKYFPEVARMMPPSEAEAFLNRPVSTIVTVRCSRYHYEDSILLIGDAAHAVSPSLGLGCNSALEDAALVDRLLDEYDDNLGDAIAQFTLRRKSDAHALVELSDYSFPSSSQKLFVEFILRQQFARILHRFLPSHFSPSLMELVSETTVPYGEILHSHRGWIDKVKKAQQKNMTVEA